jgi:hypothetical protein
VKEQLVTVRLGPSYKPNGTTQLKLLGHAFEQGFFIGVDVYGIPYKIRYDAIIPSGDLANKQNEIPTEMKEAI